MECPVSQGYESATSQSQRPRSIGVPRGIAYWQEEYHKVEKDVQSREGVQQRFAIDAGSRTTRNGRPCKLNWPALKDQRKVKGYDCCCHNCNHDPALDAKSLLGGVRRPYSEI